MANQSVMTLFLHLFLHHVCNVMPEPGTLGLLALGGIVMMRRRRGGEGIRGGASTLSPGLGGNVAATPGRGVIAAFRILSFKAS